MFAVIRNGSHQYKVAEGETLTIEKIAGEAGTRVVFGEVLVVGGPEFKIGSPTVPGASVEATIEKQDRAKKVVVFKYRRRKTYKRKRGHKQPRTIVKIAKING